MEPGHPEADPNTDGRGDRLLLPGSHQRPADRLRSRCTIAPLTSDTVNSTSWEFDRANRTAASPRHGLGPACRSVRPRPRPPGLLAPGSSIPDVGLRFFPAEGGCGWSFVDRHRREYGRGPRPECEPARPKSTHRAFAALATIARPYRTARCRVFSMSRGVHPQSPGQADAAPQTLVGTPSDTRCDRASNRGEPGRSRNSGVRNCQEMPRAEQCHGHESRASSPAGQ